MFLRTRHFRITIAVFTFQNVIAVLLDIGDPSLVFESPKVRKPVLRDVDIRVVVGLTYVVEQLPESIAFKTHCVLSGVRAIGQTSSKKVNSDYINNELEQRKFKAQYPVPYYCIISDMSHFYQCKKYLNDIN